MNNQNKDYCVRKAFRDIQDASAGSRLKSRLSNIDRQMKENRQKTEEYDKTVKLLRLVDRDKER